MYYDEMTVKMPMAQYKELEKIKDQLDNISGWLKTICRLERIEESDDDFEVTYKLLVNITRLKEFLCSYYDEEGYLNLGFSDIELVENRRLING